MGLKSIYFDP